MKQIIFFVFFTLAFVLAEAQEPVLRGRLGGAIGGMRGSVGGNRGSSRSPGDSTDGFKQRNDLKDSITITYRYLDSTRRNNIDSSINDFDRYHTIPSGYIYLGNNGLAAYPIIYKPFTKPGWDAGLHAFDLYRFTLEETKIYKTTRPFTNLGYALAAGKEQIIQAMHTQNPRQNINWGGDYRLITAPGLFTNQNTNHKSYRLYGNYVGKRKRYAATLVFLGNNLRASENGGIKNDTFLLNPNMAKRFTVPVTLAGNVRFNGNPFITTVSTGNLYKDLTIFLRQSYDIGKRDSIEVNDSTTEYLFYPKLRFQHSFSFSKYNYHYRDFFATDSIYKAWYGMVINPADTVELEENWNIISNDFSLVQFPDTKNLSQFFLLGATLETIQQTDSLGKNIFFNTKVHGEYRNRTRNRKWDMALKGEFYAAGYNAGDYGAYATLSRYLNRKLGNVSLFFTNVNRRSSFIYDYRSVFALGDNINAKKENVISFGASATNPFIELKFANHFITNYTYHSGFKKQEQYGKPINILQVSASRKTALRKNLNWYFEATMQQATGNSPIAVPLFYTRNRLAFEGRFFKNLFLSTGVEARYFTPYKMYNYSPLNGQFIPQDTLTIKNIPDVHVFFHFRIKALTVYIRGENFNTAYFGGGKLKFVNNNYGAPLYPTPSLMLRVGLRWWFVN